MVGGKVALISVCFTDDTTWTSTCVFMCLHAYELEIAINQAQFRKK